MKGSEALCCRQWPVRSNLRHRSGQECCCLGQRATRHLTSSSAGSMSFKLLVVTAGFCRAMPEALVLKGFITNPDSGGSPTLNSGGWYRKYGKYGVKWSPVNTESNGCALQKYVINPLPSPTPVPPTLHPSTAAVGIESTVNTE